MAFLVGGCRVAIGRGAIAAMELSASHSPDQWREIGVPSEPLSVLEGDEADVAGAAGQAESTSTAASGLSSAGRPPVEWAR